MGLKAEIGWLLANASETSLEYLCHQHDMKVFPPSGFKRYTTFFDDVYELLDVNLLATPEKTVQRYLKGLSGTDD